VDLNLNGTWHMSSAYGRRLIEAGKPGDIVNIAIVVNNGAPGYAHAAAARAVLGPVHATFTEGLNTPDLREARDVLAAADEGRDTVAS